MVRILRECWRGWVKLSYGWGMALLKWNREVFLARLRDRRRVGWKRKLLLSQTDWTSRSKLIASVNSSKIHSIITPLDYTNPMKIMNTESPLSTLYLPTPLSDSLYHYSPISPHYTIFQNITCKDITCF